MFRSSSVSLHAGEGWFLTTGAICNIVLDKGLLFRTNDRAFAKTKQKLLRDCDVWCIVSLPVGVFLSAGAGVKTNIVLLNP